VRLDKLWGLRQKHIKDPQFFLAQNSYFNFMSSGNNHLISMTIDSPIIHFPKRRFVHKKLAEGSPYWSSQNQNTEVENFWDLQNWIIDPHNRVWRSREFQGMRSYMLEGRYIVSICLVKRKRLSSCSTRDISYMCSFLCTHQSFQVQCSSLSS